MTDALSHVTTYDYDYRDRLKYITEADPDGAGSTYTRLVTGVTGKKRPHIQVNELQINSLCGPDLAFEAKRKGAPIVAHGWRNLLK